MPFIFHSLLGKVTNLRDTRRGRGISDGAQYPLGVPLPEWYCTDSIDAAESTKRKRQRRNSPVCPKRKPFGDGVDANRRSRSAGRLGRRWASASAPRMELLVDGVEAAPAGRRAAASSEQEESPVSPSSPDGENSRDSFCGSDSRDSRSMSPSAGSRNSSPVDRRPNSRRKGLMLADPIWARAVMDNPLLRSLGPAEIKYVKVALRLLPVNAGETVYNQEDIASEAYIVQSGVFEAVETTHTGGLRSLRELHESASFGMHEMLYGLLRECTVRCTEAGAVWLINKRVFDSKLKVCPTPSKALLEHIKGMSIFDSLPPSQYPQLCRGGAT